MAWCSEVLNQENGFAVRSHNANLQAQTHTHTEIHLLGSVSVTKNSSDYTDIIFFFINKHLMLGG